ncbi:MFS transporter [Salmonella enterica]|nr:MFS transporter [Salmonella enterica]EDB9445780.1 MFS transporter [Salmonella enterica subsp. enterica serovar Enteritidis]EBI5032922.1 MFS transporter [Salmonella enterica]EBN2823458.1 MFS transporter [Salmonella enterica]ECU1628805.1 MFS transporter [Salmonella enterica]
MQGNIFTLARVRSLPTEIHVMLAGTFLTRGAYFMVWPFLAVLLYRQFHFSATAIGSLLSMATLCGAVSGVYTGWLSDRFGRKRLILCGTTLSALAFILLSYGNRPTLYAVGIAGVSIGCALLESSCKALIGDRITDKSSRELALYCRYYAINVGAALGPLFGVTLGLASRSPTFLLTAAVYFIYGLLLWYLLQDRSSSANLHPKTSSCPPPFFMACQQMIRHRLFSLLLICNMFAALVYASFDSTLVQYLTRSGVANVLMVIAMLVMINCLTIIVAQFPLLRLLQRFSTGSRLLFGLFLMLLAQLLFAFSPAHLFLMLALATIILSLGELIVFPTFSVEVDQLTPDTLRGSYFGAANLYLLGSALAPLYGGLMLDYTNNQILFLGLAGLCLIIVLLQNGANALKVSEQKVTE